MASTPTTGIDLSSTSGMIWKKSSAPRRAVPNACPKHSTIPNLNPPQSIIEATYGPMVSAMMIQQLTYVQFPYQRGYRGV